MLIFHPLCWKALGTTRLFTYLVFCCCCCPQGCNSSSFSGTSSDDIIVSVAFYTSNTWMLFFVLLQNLFCCENVILSELMGIVMLIQVCSYGQGSYGKENYSTVKSVIVEFNKWLRRQVDHLHSFCYSIDGGFSSSKNTSVKLSVTSWGSHLLKSHKIDEYK